MQPSVIAEIDSPVFPKGTYFISPPCHTPPPKNEGRCPLSDADPTQNEDPVAPQPGCAAKSSLSDAGPIFFGVRPARAGLGRGGGEWRGLEARVMRAELQVERVAGDPTLVGEEPVFGVDASSEPGE